MPGSVWWWASAPCRQQAICSWGGRPVQAKQKTQFYLRQLSDAKIKPVIEIMKPLNLKNYAGLCGRVLARAHARTVDPVVLTGYMGKSTAFEDAIADFSVAYADQNERDHAALLDAIRSRRVEAIMDL